MKPIHKFNGGRGATLCHKCSVIISEGLTEDLYCEKCEQKIKRIMKNIHKIGENIYITSDEEIEKGDWGYNTYTKSIHTIDVVGTKNNQWKKIILTTDQDLIKDGVQPIDDEFLQWFVSKANDSGKPIDIVEVHKMCYGALSGFSDAGYKIIIPKEEQKQHLIDMMQDDEKLVLYDYKTMNDQDKTNLLFKIWLDSGMTKTEFAKLCGWKNSSNLCRLISGKVKTTYEHLEIACKVTNRNFKIEIK